MLAAATPDMRLLLLLCSQCGLRKGEALALAPQHIVDGVIHSTGKNGNRSRVPLSRDVAAILATIPTTADLVTPLVARLAPRHYSSPRATYEKQFVRLKRKVAARPELRMHDMRRLLARKVYATTGDLRSVQALLGHRQLTSTFAYLRQEIPSLSPQQLQQAIERAGVQ